MPEFPTDCAGMLEYSDHTWTCIALSVVGDKRGIRISDEDATRLCRECGEGRERRGTKEGDQ